MSHRSNDLPRAIRILLRLILPRELRSEILGDLQEEYGIRLDRDGRRSAKRWIRLQAVRSVGSAVSLRRRSVRASHDPGSGATVSARRNHASRSPLRTLSDTFVFSVRSVLRNRRHSAAVIATLALGIGINVPTFVLLRDVLLDPLPYEAPGQLVALLDGRLVSNRDLEALRTELGSFAAVESYSPNWSLVLSGADAAAVPLSSAGVSPGLFDMLGVAPALGRSFREEEENPGLHRVAMLSHEAWRTRFGSDPTILNRAIILDGQPFVVVGVMPPEFFFVAESTELWFPMEMDRGEMYSADWLQLFGRTTGDRSPESIEAEISEAVVSVRGRFGYSEDWGAGNRVEPLLDFLVGDVRGTVWLLYGSAALVLLIAIANAAGLTASRVEERRQEMGIRTSLGADRGGLVRLMIGEHLILAGLAGGVAIALGAVALPAFLHVLPFDLPRISEIRFGFGSAAALGSGTVGAGVLLGLVGGIWAFRFGGSGTRELARPISRVIGGSTRGSLLVTQIALATMLMIGAVLMSRTILELRRIDPGFSAAGTVAMVVEPSVEEDGDAAGPVIRLAFREILDRLESRPEIERTGLVLHPPLGGSWWSTEVVAENRPTGPDATPIRSAWNPILGDYLEILEIPLLDGRGFSDIDHAEAPGVALVSERLGRTLWPNETPIGKRLRYGVQQRDGWLTVVGVVGDVRNRRLDREGDGGLYVPFDQHPLAALTIVAEGSSTAPEMSPSRLSEIATAELARVGQPVTIYRTQTGDTLIEGSIRRQRATLSLLLLFTALGITLGAIGVFGMVSERVIRHRREIGIRLALGAPRGVVGWTVVGRTVRLCMVGVGSGLVGAMGIAEWIRGLVYGIQPRDPVTFAIVPILLLALALAAAYIPARRATRIDPARVLREG